MEKKYEHIINMIHPVSCARPRLSASQRAAQFAPFAALTGYEAVIQEVARQTEQEICLDESEMEHINRLLGQIRAEIDRQPLVSVRFYVPDKNKPGGSYRTVREHVVKIDETLQKIRLKNGENILFQNIIQLFVD